MKFFNCRSLPCAFLAASLVLVAGSPASAATITGGLSSPVVYSSVVISDGSSDWAYFGVGGNPATAIGKAGGPGSFSAVSGANVVGTDSRIFLSYTGGDPGPLESITAGKEFVYSGAGDGAALTFSATILAPDETIQVYLTGYNSRADISASLRLGGSFSLMGAVLPYTDDQDGDGTGEGHTYGLLTLNVAGASIGDVLTITVANQYAAVSNPAFGSIGVQAATVAVPEAASSLLGALGFACLVIKRRRN